MSGRTVSWVVHPVQLGRLLFVVGMQLRAYTIVLLSLLGWNEGSCFDECVGVCRPRPLIASNSSALSSFSYSLIYSKNSSVTISMSLLDISLAFVGVGLEETGS